MVISSRIVKKARACFFSKFSDFCGFFLKKLNKAALKVKMMNWHGLCIEAWHNRLLKNPKPVSKSYLKWRNVRKYRRRWKSWKNSKKCQKKSHGLKMAKIKNLKTWRVGQWQYLKHHEEFFRLYLTKKVWLFFTSIFVRVL